MDTPAKQPIFDNTRTVTYFKAAVPFLYHGNLCIKYGRSRIDRLKKVMDCDNILSGRR